MEGNGAFMASDDLNPQVHYLRTLAYQGRDSRDGNQ